MDTERTAEGVFRLLSDEIRVDILRTVARAQSEQRETGVTELAFSDIYDRVDVDGTSKLSYHLGELTGTFLRKHEDGYAFTHAGEQLVRFVLAGNYRRPPDFDPIETDGTCLHCGETGLRATCHDQYFLLQCPDCELPTIMYKTTPAQVEAHDGTDLLDAIAADWAGDMRKMRRGVCPDCAGRIDTEVIDVQDLDAGDAAPSRFATSSECSQCLRFLSLPLSHAVAFHPASVAFHWERGVDIVGEGLWSLHRYLYEGQWSTERVGSDPEEYRVEMRHGDESLSLYLDGTATVTRTERVRHRDGADRRS